MDDNQNKNQPNSTPSDYQKILDEYAASVKPETVQPSGNLPEEKIPADSLKETISLPPEPKKIAAETPEKSLVDDLEEAMIQKKQSETPIHPSLAVNLEENDTVETKPIGIPPVPTQKAETPIESTTPPIKTPIAEIQNSEPEISQPEKTPEEIKAEINRLLTEDETKPNDSVPAHNKNNSSVGKIFFIFALILFLLVAAGLAYFLFLVPSNTNNVNKDTTGSVPTSSVTPTTVPADTSGICELNDKTYQVGESFQSADGCNTCNCSSAGVITCTEKACTGTTTVTPATKSATVTSSTKTAFQKMITNFTLYKDITSEERLMFTKEGNYWPSFTKSTDKLYSFVQKLTKGSIKSLTINKKSLSTILGNSDYIFYLTPNYEKWTVAEFKTLDYEATGIGDFTPIYAYSDKLLWTTNTPSTCGGARSSDTTEQKIQDQCESLVKEIQTAFP